MTESDLMHTHWFRSVKDFIKRALMRLYYFWSRMLAGIEGDKSMVPPSRINFVGGGDFEVHGKIFKDYFIEYGKLQPADRVLDVGCGLGRMAVPLTGYLSKQGGYWGFDIVEMGIEWCRSRITSRYGNFHFQHADIYNAAYNPGGRFRARDYRFPYEDAFFDFVFLTSVFTHMLPPDVENYLKEIARVTRPGGTCMATFFLLNDESLGLIHAGRSSLDFKYETGDCLTTDEVVPETALAYREATVEKLFERYGLAILRPVHYGSWCARETSLTYQDLIVAKKT